MGMLADVEGLAESFHRQVEGKEVGVDGISKAGYRENLELKLADLSARVRRMGYRPQPARRVYIPKTSGGERPLRLKVPGRVFAADGVRFAYLHSLCRRRGLKEQSNESKCSWVDQHNPSG